MAKIISIEPADDGNDDTVTLLLDDGTEAVLKVDGEFFGEAEFNAMRDKEVQSSLDAQEHNTRLINELQAEIGELKQEIANRSDAPKAMLQDEHQDVPVPRTLDKLAPLDALSAHQPIDEPKPLRLEDDPDAPARPPRADQPSRGVEQALAEAAVAEETKQNTETAGSPLASE